MLLLLNSRIDIEQEPTLAMRDEIRRPLRMQPNNRQSRRKRLKDNLSKRLRKARERKNATGSVHSRKPASLLMTHKRRIKLVLIAEFRQIRTSWTVTDKDELGARANAAGKLLECFDEEAQVLFPGNTADVEDHRAAVLVVRKGSIERRCGC